MQVDPQTAQQSISNTNGAMESDHNYDLALTIASDAFHPLFSSPEADVVLAAKGSTKFFRVHSFVLKTASGFFRAMFSLPQRTSKTGYSDDVIYLDETEDTLETLLCMISGLPVNIVQSYEAIDNLIDAVEKYDMPGPLSIIRLLIMTPTLLDEPFRLFSVACRFGWEDEAKRASTQTLAYNLYDPEVREHLRRLPTGSLLSLFELHRARRERCVDISNQRHAPEPITVACANV